MPERILATSNLPTLRLGDNGEAVRLIQQLLVNFHGFSIQFNANFTQETQNAVKDFQGSHRLQVTGIVDRLTWRALGDKE
ncbi:MAG: peptidoglycan-binding domain-containing protein [Rhizonema sp. NSF051]|nr:peptidoglycan-binding domain-containing protein [Rhizonema sp. NSF051]